jgi:hypothetical protein
MLQQIAARTKRFLLRSRHYRCVTSHTDRAREREIDERGVVLRMSIKLGKAAVSYHIGDT